MSAAVARSININLPNDGDVSDNDNDNYESKMIEEVQDALPRGAKENRWNIMSEKTQDHLIKELVHHTNELGKYPENLNGECLFKAGENAPLNLKKLKKILSERDDPVLKKLRIKIHKLGLLSDKFVPLFATAMENEVLLSACLKYCIELTRDFDIKVKVALKDKIRMTKINISF